MIKTLVRFMAVKYNPSLISCNKVYVEKYKDIDNIVKCSNIVVKASVICIDDNNSTDRIIFCHFSKNDGGHKRTMLSSQ